MQRVLANWVYENSFVQAVLGKRVLGNRLVHAALGKWVSLGCSCALLHALLARTTASPDPVRYCRSRSFAAIDQWLW
jgi:hypothetical protein